MEFIIMGGFQSGGETQIFFLAVVFFFFGEDVLVGEVSLSFLFPQLCRVA